MSKLVSSENNSHSLINYRENVVLVMHSVLESLEVYALATDQLIELSAQPVLDCSGIMTSIDLHVTMCPMFSPSYSFSLFIW